MDTGNKRFTYIFIGGLIALALVIYGLEKLASKDSRYSSSAETSQTQETANDTKVKGKAEAPVTLLVYSDFQCPACAAYEPLTKQLEQAFPDTLRTVYRHFPLTTIHKNALASAKAAEAARLQGKFWEMHDQLFEHQNDWANKPDPTDMFRGYAQTIGLDMARFDEDVASDAVADAVKQDQAQGTKDKIQGTPTFFINGKQIQNPQSYEAFKKLVQDAVDAAPKPETPIAETTKAFHEHADFAVYINGKKANFSQAQYQSIKDAQGNEQERDEFVHLHDSNGSVIHLHKEGIALGYFFKTLGIEFTSDCLKFDTGQKYCSDANHSLRLLVNGQDNTQFDQYVPHDLDRILITYGTKNANVESELNSVTDQACIYSEKCPERGPAPKEECVGGLGTTCEGDE